MNPKEFDILEAYNQGELELLNPFPGLRPFTFDESHLFFGREGQSDEVLLNLAQHRFAAVIGASGSGKSSLELQLLWLNKVCKFAEEHGRTPIFWDDMPLKFAGVYDPMFNTKMT